MTLEEWNGRINWRWWKNVMKEYQVTSNAVLSQLLNNDESGAITSYEPLVGWWIIQVNINKVVHESNLYQLLWNSKNFRE